MKICLAQIKSVKGDVEENIIHHKDFIEKALTYDVDLIIFPELSITGYEPELANDLATEMSDERFNDFQEISDTKNVVICVGLPIRNANGVSIGMIIFQPQQSRELYLKKYLHSDELPFFTSGENLLPLEIADKNVGFAICYETSIQEHWESVFANGAEIYIASVAKTAEGMEKSAKFLSQISKQFSASALIVNCVGFYDNFESLGNSAVWNDKGELIGKLGENEGLLIFDTETQEIFEIAF